jgi:hypothetical protein
LILVEALFQTADDALTAATRLQTIDGVREIRTERRSNDEENDRDLLLAGSLGTAPGNLSTTVSYNAGGVYTPIGPATMSELFGGRDRIHDMVLTCKVDESQLQEAVDAVKRAGGTIVTGS